MLPSDQVAGDGDSHLNARVEVGMSTSSNEVLQRSNDRKNAGESSIVGVEDTEAEAEVMKGVQPAIEKGFGSSKSKTQLFSRAGFEIYLLPLNLSDQPTHHASHVPRST